MRCCRLLQGHFGSGRLGLCIGLRECEYGCSYVIPISRVNGIHLCLASVRLVNVHCPCFYLAYKISRDPTSQTHNHHYTSIYSPLVQVRSKLCYLLASPSKQTDLPTSSCPLGITITTLPDPGEANVPVFVSTAPVRETSSKAARSWKVTTRRVSLGSMSRIYLS